MDSPERPVRAGGVSLAICWVRQADAGLDRRHAKECRGEGARPPQGVVAMNGVDGGVAPPVSPDAARAAPVPARPAAPARWPGRTAAAAAQGASGAECATTAPR